MLYTLHNFYINFQLTWNFGFNKLGDKVTRLTCTTNSRLSRRKSDEALEPESKVVVESLLDDIIGDVVKEKEESENWERLVSTSKLVGDSRAQQVDNGNGPCSDPDEDSDGCFDDRRRLPYDFCTKMAADDDDYSSATTTTSDDDSVAAAAAASNGRATLSNKKGRSSSTSSSSGAFSRAAYVNRRRKRKRPPMTLEVALAKRRVAVEMLSLKGRATTVENSLPSSADEIGERQLASPLDLEPSGFVEDEFSPLPEVDHDSAACGGEEVCGRGKRLRRANSRYSDDAT